MKPLWIWKAEIWLNWMRFKNKRARRLYCRKGFHKITSHKESWKEPKKKWAKVQYLRCVHCNYKFFTTLKQKERYLKHESAATDSFSSFLRSLSSAKSKRSLASADKRGEDVSASVKT